MNTERTKPDIDDAQASQLLDRITRRNNSIRDAHRPHNRLLLLLWAFGAIAISLIQMIFGFNSGTSVSPADLAISSSAPFFVCVFTGIYAFSESAALHKRLDAVLTLIDTK
jgi:hypothetical protein